MVDVPSRGIVTTAPFSVPVTLPVVVTVFLSPATFSKVALEGTLWVTFPLPEIVKADITPLAVKFSVLESVKMLAKAVFNA